MYTFSNRLKIVSIIFIVLGLVGVGVGFMNSHKTLEEVEQILSHESHHGGSHSTDVSHSDDHNNHVSKKHEEVSHESNSHDAHDAHEAHLKHVQHQIANRPWASIYVAAFFFMMIALGVLAFYAIQIAAQAGWSPLLFRVMEGITSYLLPGALIVLAIAVASGVIGHYNIFIWMDPDVVAHDKLIQGKSGWLNISWFAIRGLIFIAGWSAYRFLSRKFSLAQDQASDNSNFDLYNNIQNIIDAIKPILMNSYFFMGLNCKK